jgi:hypothetical protein
VISVAIPSTHERRNCPAGNFSEWWPEGRLATFCRDSRKSKGARASRKISGRRGLIFLVLFLLVLSDVEASRKKEQIIDIDTNGNINCIAPSENSKAT